MQSTIFHKLRASDHAIKRVSNAAAAVSAVPRHVAIIMDGNRRWAARRGYAPHVGHKQGADNLSKMVEALGRYEVGWVTLFAFSAANWQRPVSETDRLWQLARSRFEGLAPRCAQSDLRVEFIGRRDRLPDTLQRSMEKLSAQTRSGQRCLRIALDYSAQWSIWQAARGAGPGQTFAAFARQLCGDAPPVDLLIRTGNEQRLSDFLLWECAFAELYFSTRYWPDFNAQELDRALAWYAGRQRRYGS